MFDGASWAWWRRFLSGCVAMLLCLCITYSVMSGGLSPLYLEVGNGDSGALPVVILDPGHGGEDPGALGVNGVYEKDLNLALATLVADELRGAGYQVVLTRTEDRLVYDPATVKPGHKKVADLAGRAAVAANYPGCIFVSIHMNSFPQSDVHGLQIWYAKGSEESQKLAQEIRKKVLETVEKDNRRPIKASSGNMYLLDRATEISVLVECGFLTNSADCAKLSDATYQKELSFAIFCAIINYIGNRSEDV